VFGVVGAVVAVGVFLGLRLITSDADGAPGTVAGGADPREANAVTATATSDFDAVCKKGSVTNAAAYGEPYTIVAFGQGDRQNSWDEIGLTGPHAAQDQQWSSVNTVACLTRKAGTEVESGTCEFESGSGTVAVTHLAVEYEVEVFEAATGESIENLGTVNGPALDCPMLAFFQETDPKIYGPPDQAAVAAKLEEFAAR